MRPIINILFIAIISFTIFGCKDIDNLYKQHLDAGPILYIGKADSVVAFSGRDRLMLRWLKMQDPRATKAIITWANGTQSKTVELTNNDHYTNVIIDNLLAGTFSFKIVSYDNSGHSSVPVEAFGNVYSSDYETYIKTRPHISFSTSTMLLKFKKVTADPTFVETEISYIKIGESQPTVVKLSGDATDIVLIGCDITKPITYRGVHRPEPTCIDKFYSPTVAINP